jgi:uncharacterized protein YnzC (UPF0291/DUF896 family)
MALDIEMIRRTKGIRAFAAKQADEKGVNVTLGLDFDYDENGYVTTWDTEKLGPEPDATQIQESFLAFQKDGMKTFLRELVRNSIVSIISEDDQRNLIARMVELSDKKTTEGLTLEEAEEETAARQVWSLIKALRDGHKEVITEIDNTVGIARRKDVIGSWKSKVAVITGA